LNLHTPIITLTTDFGHDDPYVGIMKGVILGITPQARIVDLCHQIPAYDTEAAAFCVVQAVPYFPPGSIHLIVVDPGVGTDRRGLIVQGKQALYVAPDNGVLGPLMAADTHLETFEIAHVEGGTFHGRDVFAPAAARLALGSHPNQLGAPVPQPSVVNFPGPKRTDDGWLGRIIHVDRFGNLITNLSHRHFSEMTALRIGNTDLPLADCYGDVTAGGMAALLGSARRVEVFIREGSAHETLKMGRGTPVLGRTRP
jgi:S-adenosylmethionine hydrolase